MDYLYLFLNWESKRSVCPALIMFGTNRAGIYLVKDF